MEMARHIIFSHGKESGPWGSKITTLSDLARSRGFTTESIDYRHTMNPEERVAILSDHLNAIKESVILVGSSMGGYTSICNANHQIVERLFLLAPALYIEGYRQQCYQSEKPTTIVHGWSDEVIPFDNSLRYASSSNNTLHLIAGDHRLSSSIENVSALFEQFLIQQ